MHALYICLSYFFHIFAKFFLKIRVAKKKEDPIRYLEKLGFYKIENNNPVIWFHASSLGEVKSIVPLIFHYSKEENVRILITTVTLSSSEYCAKIFQNSPNVIHQFSPLDTPIIVKKFLEHWKPKISIFVESELWPNLIFQCKKISKLILLNARLSKKSFSRWKLIKKFSQDMLGQFDSITAQSKEVRSLIEFFNIKNVNFYGNLKFVSIDDLRNDRNFNFQKKINYSWVAMSTHRGEEEFVIQAIKNIKEKKFISQCILIPRHVTRIKEITDLIETNNLTYQLKSQEPSPLENKDLYIVDSYGEAKKIFNKVGLVFLGGSIIAHGGQNPLEPAHEGCSIFHGPNVYNFTEIYDFLANNGISQLVTSADSLANSLIAGFEKPMNNSKFKETMEQYSQKILLDHINYLNSFIKE
jgi:3-deoxy-D-manno-octulosonic-acid transferase